MLLTCTASMLHESQLNGFQIMARSKSPDNASPATGITPINFYYIEILLHNNVRLCCIYIYALYTE